MKKLKAIIPVVLCATFILYITGILHNDNKIPESIVSASDIASIKIEYTNYMPYYHSEHIFDFNNNTCTYKNDDDNEKVRHFSEEKKENFINKANMYGFFYWQEEYSINAYDGIHEHFLTIYNDGSQHETWCENAYPLTCDEMWDAFLEII